MPPILALCLWLGLLLALLALDPAKYRQGSIALWIPVIWMFFTGSRLPSVWISGIQAGAEASALQEGNGLDRAVLSFLMLLAIGVLLARSFNWAEFTLRNFSLVLFLSFALLSVLWSDFPLVSAKRWFRDLGGYFMILVVLSDHEPLEAVRTFLRRTCYLLIPLSVVLIKYFPDMGKQYGVWDGSMQFTGVATSKNMLGVLCLVSGMFFFWDTIVRWHDHKTGHTKRILFVNSVFLLMTFWLLKLSNSVTSRVCLIIGCIVIYLAHGAWGQRHRSLLKLSIPMIFLAYVILAFGFNLKGELASQVGRDPTLTDRTLIWAAVLNEHTNPLVGTGYESFWLGPRLPRIWEQVGAINEAHNGYLDVYLTLGFIGLTLLFLFLIAGYWRIWKKFGTLQELGTLCLGVWTVLLFYNVTEAAFKGGLLWTAVLLGAMTVPTRHTEEVEYAEIVYEEEAADQYPPPEWASAGQHR